MMGDGERDLERTLVDRAAGIHRIALLDALPREIPDEVGIADHLRAGVARDRDGIADMVAMAMGEDDMRDAARRGGGVTRKFGVAGEERVNENDRVGDLDAERGVAEPGQFHEIDTQSLLVAKVWGPVPAATSAQPVNSEAASGPRRCAEERQEAR